MSQQPEVTAIKFDFEAKSLLVLDQTLLPKEIKHIEVSNCEQGFNAIKTMIVRGAPGIAAVGCLSIICELNQKTSDFSTRDELNRWLDVKRGYMRGSRPTAVNLTKALDKLVGYNLEIQACNSDLTVAESIELLTKYCGDAIVVGERLNRDLGTFGAELLEKRADKNLLSVLTHCNTGALATVGYGTALGVIRSLHKRARLERAYCTETRPYNQGSRLTAWELVREKIPATLIADNMVAYLFASKKIDAVVVGADCVAINGDTANKIGTLQIAVIAKHYGVPFYVAAPTQSISVTTKDMSDIKIEFRPADEMRKLGNVLLAPEEVDVWNPCFDVTQADLITSIITQLGACKPIELANFMAKQGANLDDGNLY